MKCNHCRYCENSPVLPYSGLVTSSF